MGLSLTNPGLAYQDLTIDPTTGQPIVKPRVAFFPNNAARSAQYDQDTQKVGQYLADSQKAIANAPMTIDSETGAPIFGKANLPANPPSAIPTMFKPSFAQTQTDAQGLPAPINPAQSKLGKLLSILGAAAAGGVAGWGTGNAAAGADRAREIPMEMAQKRAELATTQAGLQPVQTPYGTMPAVYGTKIFPSMIGAQGRVAAADIGAQSRQNVAQTGAQARVQAAQIEKRFIPVPGVGLFDASSQQVLPGTSNGVPVTDEIAKDYNLPADAVGKVLPLTAFASLQRAAAQYAPVVESEQSTTDILGNTNTRKTTQKVAPGLPNPANLPGVATSGTPQPRTTSVPTGTNSVPGTPVVRTSTPSRAPVSGPNTSPLASMPLAPDVEQRLAASGLKPVEQQYVRGLLNYQGQMPSPRAKNYAATLATLTSIDPNFNAANYDANKKTLQDYTPGGSMGKQAVAFNTAIAHLDMLDQAAVALKNSNAIALNKIANFLKVQTGNSAVTTFNNIADAVDGEVSKTFKGTATEGELARVGAHFSAALGPDQIQNNIRSTIGLLNGKMGEMQSAFQRQIGRPINMVSPEAQRAIQRMSGGQPSHDVYAPDGKTLIGHVINNRYVPLQ